MSLPLKFKKIIHSTPMGILDEGPTHKQSSKQGGEKKKQLNPSKTTWLEWQVWENSNYWTVSSAMIQTCIFEWNLPREPSFPFLNYETSKPFIELRWVTTSGSSNLGKCNQTSITPMLISLREPSEYLPSEHNPPTYKRNFEVVKNEKHWATKWLLSLPT